MIFQTLPKIEAAAVVSSIVHQCCEEYIVITTARCCNIEESEKQNYYTAQDIDCSGDFLRVHCLIFSFVQRYAFFVTQKRGA